MSEMTLSRTGLPVRIVRLSAVYGSGFPFMLEAAIRRGLVLLPGDGLNIVPTIHIDDAVAGLIRIATAGTESTYNLADRDPLPLRSFYALVQRRVGGRPVRFVGPWIPRRLDVGAALLNQGLHRAIRRQPRFTTDALTLFKASARLQVDRLTGLGMQWRYPRAADGLSATPVL